MSAAERRTRRISRDGTEVRQLLDFVLEGMVEQSKRTAAALLEAGYSRAEVNEATLAWWDLHAVDALGDLAFDFKYLVGLERGRQLLERGIAAHDAELLERARAMVVQALAKEER